MSLSLFYSLSLFISLSLSILSVICNARLWGFYETWDIDLWRADKSFHFGKNLLKNSKSYFFLYLSLLLAVSVKTFQTGANLKRGDHKVLNGNNNNNKNNSNSNKNNNDNNDNKSIYFWNLTIRLEVRKRSFNYPNRICDQ